MLFINKYLSMAQSDLGATGSRDEVLCLLELWSDDRNTGICRQLAADLKKNRGDMAIDRTPEQCRSKLKALIQEYHQSKKNNKKYGCGRSKIAFFDVIDGVLQNKPSTSPNFYLHTSAVTEPETTETESAERSQR